MDVYIVLRDSGAYSQRDWEVFGAASTLEIAQQIAEHDNHSCFEGELRKIFKRREDWPAEVERYRTGVSKWAPANKPKHLTMTAEDRYPIDVEYESLRWKQDQWWKQDQFGPIPDSFTTWSSQGINYSNSNYAITRVTLDALPGTP